MYILYCRAAAGSQSWCAFEGHHKGLRLCCTDFTYCDCNCPHVIVARKHHSTPFATQSPFAELLSPTRGSHRVGQSVLCGFAPSHLQPAGSNHRAVPGSRIAPTAHSQMRLVPGLQLPCESIAKRRTAGHLLASARIPSPSHVVWVVSSALASPLVFDLQSHLSAGHLSSPAHFCLLCFLAVQAAAAG